MSELRAYHGDPGIKALYLTRVQAHREADALVQGTGWEDGRGCAVGCTLEVYDHSRYPAELGLPVSLAYLEDKIFEVIPRKDAMAWPERFLAAIPVGSDAQAAVDRWTLWLLLDATSPLARWREEDWMRGVTQLYERRLNGDEPSKADWAAAKRLADAHVETKSFPVPNATMDRASVSAARAAKSMVEAADASSRGARDILIHERVAHAAWHAMWAVWVVRWDEDGEANPGHANERFARANRLEQATWRTMADVLIVELEKGDG